MMVCFAIDENNRLLIAAGTKIVSVNVSTATILHSMTVPSISKTNNNHEDNNEINVNEKCETKPSLNDSINRIQHIAISPNWSYLAVTTTIDKLLYLYSYAADTGSLELISIRDISRTSSAIRFSQDSQNLLVADKSGDCYLYDCLDTTKPATWLLAHLSMVLDVMFTDDNRFIVTCDRDEKIRLTHYPYTHLIEGYCLGHTEYVSSVRFLPTHSQEILLSISGDKTIKLWHLPECEELCEFELEAPAFEMALKKHSNVNHVAITYIDSVFITIHKISKQNSFEINQIGKYEFCDIKSICGIQYDGTGSIFIIGLKPNGNVALHKLQSIEDQYEEQNLCTVNQVLCKELDLIQVAQLTDELPILFKKKFDNIHDYQERKKRRIEEKNKKR